MRGVNHLKKLTISSVFKQDLDVIIYLLVYGGVALLARRYLVDGDLALLFGAAADYLLYRIKTELKNKGYVKALGK
jgi:hypothetical protein